MAHSKQIAETVDYVLDDIIAELGCEPDGHKTWAKTTDEIVETIKPILIEALHTAERRGEERERERIRGLIVDNTRHTKRGSIINPTNLSSLLSSIKPTSDVNKLPKLVTIDGEDVNKPTSEEERLK